MFRELGINYRAHLRKSIFSVGYSSEHIYNHLILNVLPPPLNFCNHLNNKFIFMLGKNKFILRWGCWAGILSGLVNNVFFTNDLTYENFD